MYSINIPQQFISSSWKKKSAPLKRILKPCVATSCQVSLEKSRHYSSLGVNQHRPRTKLKIFEHSSKEKFGAINKFNISPILPWRGSWCRNLWLFVAPKRSVLFRTWETSVILFLRHTFHEFSCRLFCLSPLDAAQFVNSSICTYLIFVFHSSGWAHLVS